jgi:hypothetical protein
MTEIRQALYEDLYPITQEYDGGHAPLAIQLAAHRQIQDFDKKFVFGSKEQKALEKKTFEDFLDVNREIGMVNDSLRESLPDPVTRIQSTTSFADRVHLRARAICHFVLKDHSEDDWFMQSRHSAGSTSGVPFIDTSLEKKSTLPITISGRCISLYQRYLTFNTSLEDAMIGKDHNVQMFRIVDGPRATTVDKSTEKRRMICPVPTGNMYFQQGLMHLMYADLKDVGLDLERLPDLHKDLAKESSISGKNATIDWSSASDRNAIELVRWLLPPKWFDRVWTVRSDYVSLNKKLIQLEMISTMGNATTFPIELLVFWSYAHAVRMSLEKGNSLFPEWEDLKLISVFGDDCIVPSSMADTYVSFMESIGFKLNRDKSYFGSNSCWDEEFNACFRESCGGDYYAGHDVRPFHIRAPVNDRVSSLGPWLNIIMNSLLKKYIVYFGETSYVYERRLWRTIFDIYARYDIQIRLVPDFYPDDAGLKLSGDSWRFALSYDIWFDTIAEDVHGSKTFRYYRFVYHKKESWNDKLRYLYWLKRPTQSLQPKIAHERPKRKRGGYVVARGLTSHWTL